MKDGGLGTPATRASIIETLLKRGYVQREGKMLAATPVGEGLIDALPVEALRSPELTGAWESRLTAMARGNEARARFMADIADFVTRAVNDLRGASLLRATERSSRPSQSSTAPTSRRVTAAPTSLPPRVGVGARAGAPVEGLVCPVCNLGAIVVGHRAWGCARWKDGCRTVIPFAVGAKKITDAQLRDLVLRGQTRAASFEVDGRPQRARLRLDRSAAPPTVRVEVAVEARGAARGRAASPPSHPR
jgi:DNA topoisomerase-3